MQAIVQNDYGSPDVFAPKEIDKPVPQDNEVLVRVRAASIAAGDLFGMRGSPYVARMTVGWPKPKDYVPGLDLAGTVESVGANVTRLKPGDEVYGEVSGACAEYTCGAEDKLVLKPSNFTFQQAAALPVSAVTALQGLRDAGKLESGQKVLITGASGGVGTFAVQIAKAMEAEVTGVCSTRNVDMVRSIGADHVIDYTQDDFTQGDERYDLILDQVASHSLSETRRVLAPDGVLQPNSGHAGMGYIIAAAFSSMFSSHQNRPFVATPKNEDLVTIKEMCEAGEITPVIAKTFPLSETAEAFRYLDQGHPGGKIVISVSD
jgi:NADPH:quinone reductase-like Zn-dependent oxidoreductase